jgi:hypothetical protein
MHLDECIVHSNCIGHAKIDVSNRRRKTKCIWVILTVAFRVFFPIFFHTKPNVFEERGYTFLIHLSPIGNGPPVEANALRYSAIEEAFLHLRGLMPLPVGDSLICMVSAPISLP